jgi:hypothetical protein
MQLVNNLFRFSLFETCKREVISHHRSERFDVILAIDCDTAVNETPESSFEIVVVVPAIVP